MNNYTRNTQTISNNTVTYNKAKKDYATGFYTWHDLKQKYHLNTKEVFKVIFEVKKEQEQELEYHKNTIGVD